MKICSGKNMRLCMLALLPLVLVSCKKDPDEIGLEVQDPSENVEVFTDAQSEIVAYSVREDSIRTDESPENVLGSYLDPVFGRTTAGFYTQLRLSENGHEFGNGPALDSMVLILDYSGYYGDTNALQTVRMFEMAEEIYQDSAYYSNDHIDHTGIELASYAFYPRPETPANANEGSEDPQLRIKLNGILGEKFLNEPASTFLDNDAFLEFFKGLYVTADPAPQNGSLLSFDLLSAVSKMVIHYSNEEQDSLQFEFLINDNVARFNTYEHDDYMHASMDFKEQVLNGDTALGGNKLYIQTMAGVKAKLRLPDIRRLSEDGKIAVNEAKLIIHTASFEEGFDPPAQLALVKINEDGTSSILLDQFESYFGGTYDPAAHQYVFRPNRYIQRLINGEENSYGLYLFAAGSSYHTNRAVLMGPDPDPEQEKRLKLRITYTRVE